MKLYLAHPLELRKQVREKELEFERETEINLVNPFYDTERSDIKNIDSGLISREDSSLDYNGIVLHDLSLIDNSDGIIAYLDNVRMVGTVCEMWHALTIGKPVYIIDKNNGHVWVRYIAEKSYGKTFTNWEEIIEFFRSPGKSFVNNIRNKVRK